MRIRKLMTLMAIAASLSLGTAVAQENDEATDSEATTTERQRPDRDEMRKRRENMSDEQRAAMRERWEGMSSEERQAAREKMRARRGGKDRHGSRGQRNGKQRQGDRPHGERQPKAENDEV